MAGQRPAKAIAVIVKIQAGIAVAAALLAIGSYCSSDSLTERGGLACVGWSCKPVTKKSLSNKQTYVQSEGIFPL